MKGCAAGVREYLKKLPPGETARPKEIAFDLRLARPQVKTALNDMRRRGEIRRVSSGHYQYARPGYKPRPARIKTKILRAMHVKGAFSVREIAILTDAHRTYIGQVLKKLLDRGDLKTLPKQFDETVGQKVPRYRVRNPDEFYRRYIL